MARPSADFSRIRGLHGGTPYVPLTTSDARSRRRSRRRPRRNTEIAAAETHARGYFKDLNRLVRELYKDIAQQIVTKIPKWVKEEQELNSSDAMDEELAFLIERLKEQYRAPAVLFEYQDAARKAERRTKAANRVRAESQIKDLGIDVFKEPSMARLSNRFVRRNVALITSIPQQALTNVERVVESGVQAGLRASDIAEQILAVTTDKNTPPSELEKARNRAALIARDQTLSHSAQLSRARQRANGITKFVWRTVGDGRVRDLHEDRDGKEYTWEDGAGAKDKYPGDGINCRCSAEPVL